eukprot:1155033-Pelagomonas_calceolata.AAC.8
MEQQSVSVAKAGLVASLPARTAIMAAANPVEGHYNRSKSIAENLKMSPAMLSRWAGKLWQTVSSASIHRHCRISARPTSTAEHSAC